MFVVAYEEQARTEEILRLALPQLRSKHLLLASFGTFEEENEQFRVRMMMSYILCVKMRRTVRFCRLISEIFMASYS